MADRIIPTPAQRRLSVAKGMLRFHTRLAEVRAADGVNMETVAQFQARIRLVVALSFARLRSMRLTGVELN